MTVSSTARTAGPFLGNGVATSFPFAFKVFTKTELLVKLVDGAGARTAQVLDSTYSVALNADQDAAPGGTITYPLSGPPMAAGLSLTVQGNTSPVQPLDLVNAGKFLPQALENELDRLTMMTQEYGANSLHAIRFAATDAVDGELASVAFLKNRLLQFNASTGLPEPTPYTTTQVANAAAAAYFSGNVAPLAWGVGFVNAPVGIGGDDTAAIQAAIDALPAGWTLALPPGILRYTTLTINKALILRGSGMAPTATLLRSTSATLDGIVIATTSQVELLGFCMDSSVPRTAGAFVKVGTNAIANGLSILRRIEFASPYVAINIVSAVAYTVENCYFATPVSTFIQIADIAGADAGDGTIFNCTFDAGPHNTTVHILQTSGGGLRILNNKFIGGAYHIFVQMAGATSILIVTGNSSEGAGTSNIALTGTNPITFSKVVLTGNQFSLDAGASGIQVADPGYAFLDDATIGGNTFNLAAGAAGMVLNRGSRLSILPNSFIGNGAGTVGITFGANCTATVSPQNMPNVGTRYNGVLTNVTFVPGGLVQSGTAVSAATSIAYGGVFISAANTLVFPTAFPKVPSLSLKCTDVGSGAGVVLVDGSITATQFQYKAIGVSVAALPKIQWEASGG